MFHMAALGCGFQPPRAYQLTSDNPERWQNRVQSVAIPTHDGKNESMGIFDV